MDKLMTFAVTVLTGIRPVDAWLGFLDVKMPEADRDRYLLELEVEAA
jgi:hypothetical protein